MSARVAPAVSRSVWIGFLESWLDRWLAAVPGRDHHNGLAVEVMRLGL